ncbi:MULTISPECIES: precorrin-3B synthase [unclassified Streptomyces]|uniref:precorrin-3B synthase n=1 Tax=unclassified Streptomyces TaxID=2593676 RepID=UPI003829F0B3
MLAAMPPPATSPVPTGAASVRDRGDACPGALRLHRADDGALARVRIPGGVLSAAQADVLRELAERLGDGELHLTSRGNVQLRGLRPDCGGELASRMGESGLLPSERHERVRNIVASPLSGLDGRGQRDIRPWLSALDELVCASDLTTELSGRFLFALDDGRGDVDPLGADVTLLALAGGDAALRIGPAETVLRIPGAHAPRAALTAAETFLDTARGSGVWRVTELRADGGILRDQVARRLRQAGVRAAHTTLRQTGTGAAHTALRQAGIRSTRTGGPVRPARSAAPAPAPGVVDGPYDTVALSVGAPLGRLGAEQWRALTRAARQREGGGELRLTPWRGVVVPGVERARAAVELAALGAAGLITGPRSPWTGVGACVGRPGCAKSLADVRAGAAAALGPAGALPVYWSGCERRCGHPQGTWVDVVAAPDGYRVSLVCDGERQAPLPVADSPAALAAAVAAARGGLDEQRPAPRPGT